MVGAGWPPFFLVSMDVNGAGCFRDVGVCSLTVAAGQGRCHGWRPGEGGEPQGAFTNRLSWAGPSCAGA